MSTTQEWRQRSRKLGGSNSYGLECGMLQAGGPAKITANFGDFSVRFDGHTMASNLYKQGLVCHTDFMWVMNPTFVLVNEYVDVGSLLPEGFITEKILPIITGDDRDDMSMFAIIATDANTAQNIYVRVTDSSDNAAFTKSLQTRYQAEMRPNEEDENEYPYGFHDWLTNELHMDKTDVSVETLMRLLQEQYGIEVPLREVMGKIAYILCKANDAALETYTSRSEAMEKYWPHIEGTSYEQKFINMVTGADILDSQRVKTFTSMILGD